MRIDIHNLCKTYANGGVTALQDVDLDISTGMFGLLGPNGAGKSTLMKILSTLEMPTSGQVLINGVDIHTQRKEVRQSLGYLPQQFGVYPQLTGAEFLAYIAKLHNLSGVQKAVAKTLRTVGLYDVRDRKSKTYSGGMMRRLGIAQAIISDPKILIVDEPTVGLDPEERIRFRNLVTEISHHKIIILSTHIVADISSTCQDLALLSQGKVVFRGVPSHLVAKATDKVWQLECEETDFKKIARRMLIISSIQKDRHLMLRVVGDPVAGFDMKPVAPNLEDAYMYFMEYVGEHLTEEVEN